MSTSKSAGLQASPKRHAISTGASGGAKKAPRLASADIDHLTAAAKAAAAAASAIAAIAAKIKASEVVTKDAMTVKQDVIKNHVEFFIDKPIKTSSLSMTEGFLTLVTGKDFGTTMDKMISCFTLNYDEFSYKSAFIKVRTKREVLRETVEENENIEVGGSIMVLTKSKKPGPLTITMSFEDLD